MEKRAHNFDDKTGHRYGRLIVIGLERIETLKSSKKRSIWRCLCDCGNTCYIRAANLTCNITKSCGCLSFENMNKFIQTHVKKPPGIRCHNAVYNSYKTGSRSRGLEFKLSMEEFVELTKQTCYYCDDEPHNVKKSEYGNGDFTYNGIDRVNNELGYILENCVPCCYVCNFMKRALSLDIFIDQSIKISNNWKEKYEKQT